MPSLPVRWGAMSNNNARYVVAPTVTGAQAPCACVLHGAGSVAKFDVLNLCFYNQIHCVATRLPAVLGQMKVREVLGATACSRRLHLNDRKRTSAVSPTLRRFVLWERPRAMRC